MMVLEKLAGLPGAPAKAKPMLELLQRLREGTRQRPGQAK